MNRSAVIIASLTLLLSSVLSAQDTRNAQEANNVGSEMRSVYKAFRELQSYLYTEQEFLDPANEAEITELLRVLSGRFHKVELLDEKFSKEPGFAVTLRITSQMLDDARVRFKEGKKEYAQWRLKASTSYCVSCHTRFEVPGQFAGDDAKVSKLTQFEQAEFYLASRRFEKAKELYKSVVLNPAYLRKRMDALRKLLVIYTRVSPDPQEALSTLGQIKQKVRLSAYELDEVNDWMKSLRRWQNESKGTNISFLTRAENLIRQALSPHDPLNSGKGSVELLRATALLHKALDFEGESKSSAWRAHVLYLLGLAYSELHFFFLNELPELFLEQAIREAAGGEEAKKAYRLYRDIVTLSYTGSGGTRLPDEILLKFKELHDIAYGVPQLKGQI